MPGITNLGACQAPIIVGNPDYITTPRVFLDIEKTVDKEMSILRSNAWLGMGHKIHPKSVHWEKRS